MNASTNARWLVLALPLAALLAVLLWPESTPLRLHVVSREPAALTDETGQEQCLYHLAISNVSRTTLYFDSSRWQTLVANVNGSWSPTECRFNLAYLNPQRPHIIAVALPREVQNCRFTCRYAKSSVCYQLASFLGRNKIPVPAFIYDRAYPAVGKFPSYRTAHAAVDLTTAE